jgi:hypothetical protein
MPFAVTLPRPLWLIVTFSLGSSSLASDQNVASFASFANISIVITIFCFMSSTMLVLHVSALFQSKHIPTHFGRSGSCRIICSIFANPKRRTGFNLLNPQRSLF